MRECVEWDHTEIQWQGVELTAGTCELGKGYSGCIKRRSEPVSVSKRILPNGVTYNFKPSYWHHLSNRWLTIDYSCIMCLRLPCVPHINSYLQQTESRRYFAQPPSYCVTIHEIIALKKLHIFPRSVTVHRFLLYSKWRYYLSCHVGITGCSKSKENIKGTAH
jgi:hypothetical protein